MAERLRREPAVDIDHRNHALDVDRGQPPAPTSGPPSHGPRASWSSPYLRLLGAASRSLTHSEGRRLPSLRDLPPSLRPTRSGQEAQHHGRSDSDGGGRSESDPGSSAGTARSQRRGGATASKRKRIARREGHREVANALGRRRGRDAVILAGPALVATSSLIHTCSQVRTSRETYRVRSVIPSRSVPALGSGSHLGTCRSPARSSQPCWVGLGPSILDTRARDPARGLRGDVRRRGEGWPAWLALAPPLVAARATCSMGSGAVLHGRPGPTPRCSAAHHTACARARRRCARGDPSGTVGCDRLGQAPRLDLRGGTSAEGIDAFGSGYGETLASLG